MGVDINISYVESSVQTHDKAIVFESSTVCMRHSFTMDLSHLTVYWLNTI